MPQGNLPLSKQPLRKIVLFLGKRLVVLLLLSILTGVILSVVELCFAYGLQAFLAVLGVANLVNLSIPAWIPVNNLYLATAFLVTAGFSRSVLQWVQESLRGVAYEEFRHHQRERLIKWAYFGENVSSSVVNNLINERINLAAGLIMNLQVTLMQLTVAVFLVISMLRIESKLTLLLALLSFLAFLPIRSLNKKVKSSGEILASEWKHVNDRLLMSLKNLLLLRIYAMEAAEYASARKALKNYLYHSLLFFRTTGFLVVLPQTVGIVLICSATVFARSSLQLSPGELVTYFYLFIRFSQNISASTSSLSKVSFHWPQISELFRWWDTQSLDGSNQNQRNASLEDRVKLPGQIDRPIQWKIQNLSFSYPGSHNKKLVDRLNLEITPGSVLVITGPSGAGKSTLLNLFLGELLPTEGEVLIQASTGVYPVQDIRRQMLYQIGYVGPESFLIEGTIRENLLYGLTSVPTEDELNKTLEKSECQFVQQFEKKLEHLITEHGQGLSAGQKQRIALARALLRKPKALILDEATANLDELTELKLIETLSRIKGETTIIAVTHRQALLKIADKHLALTE